MNVLLSLCCIARRMYICYAASTDTHVMCSSSMQARARFGNMFEQCVRCYDIIFDVITTFFRKHLLESYSSKSGAKVLSSPHTTTTSPPPAKETDTDALFHTRWYR